MRTERTRRMDELILHTGWWWWITGTVVQAGMAPESYEYLYGGFDIHACTKKEWKTV